MRRVFQAIFDHPLQVHALIGRCLGHTLEEIAASHARLTGRHVTRQAIYANLVNGTRDLPEIQSISVPLAHRTRNKAAQVNAKKRITGAFYPAKR
jgi:hypothetical protein